MQPNLTQIRDEFPAVQRMAYLNTGSYGPLSRVAARTIEEANQQQLTEGRLGSDIGEANQAMAMELRGCFARLLGCTADEIALTHHTTDGMNIATWGVPYQPGDEIVTTSWEHPGGLLPVYAVARRFNLTVRTVPLSLDDDDASILQKFKRAIGPRTRLVSVAHVSWKTGTVLPIAEIADLVHQHRGLLAVDGAQSGGAISLNMPALDVDFYAIPGQKWLCGPEGTGALYVNRERLRDLRQTFVGYPSLRDAEAFDESGVFLPSPGAVRYEVGTVYRPATAGLWAGLQWMEELGFDWIYDRTQSITRHTRAVLSAIPGVRVVQTPTHAGLTSFVIDGTDPVAIVDQLAERGVYIRSVSNPDLLRASTHFFNDETDIEQLQAGIRSIHFLKSQPRL